MGIGGARQPEDRGSARALIVTLPIAGHVQPVVPVAAELVARDVRVDVLTSDALAPRFAGGMRIHRYPDAFCRWIGHPPPNPFAVAAGLARWADERLLEQTLDLIDVAQPDVVLTDSMTPWARLAASRRGIPLVTATTSFLISGLAAAPLFLPEAARQLALGVPAAARLLKARRTMRRRAGVDPGGATRLLSNRGDATIVFTSPALQPGGRPDASVHLVGPTSAGWEEPVDPGSELAEALADDTRPIGYASLGTVYNRQPELLGRATRALDAAGCRPIVALGTGVRPDDLGPVPRDALLLPVVPQPAVLERASVFLTHGGLNGVHEALWHGVPMVLRPIAADQPVVARRVAQLGAGTVVRRRLPSVGELTLALRWARRDPVRRAAAELGADLRRTAGAPAAADVILAHAARGG